MRIYETHTPLLGASWPVQDGSVTNIAQAVGDKLYVTVDGQGTPASLSTELPYEVQFWAWIET